MGGPYRLFFEFFKNSHFWPFFGGFWVKIDPKIDIFTKSGRIFFWQGPGRILDSKWVYQEYFQGHAEFGAEIRIFSGRNWTQKPPNLRFFQKLGLCTKSWRLFLRLGLEGIGWFNHNSQTFFGVFWCRNLHFQWSKFDLETPQFEFFFRN